MYYGRKKGIIIAIIVVLTLLIIGIGGTCLYMFTDLFKSNEKLFWKYVDKEITDIDVSSNLQMEDIQKKKEQTPYITNGEIKLSSTNEEVNTLLEGIQISFDGKVDKTNNYSYLESKIKGNNQDIFNLKYIQDENLYGLKSDEIVTAFLAVRNENLNVLMQKLAIEGIEVPDKIEKTEKANLLKITDEELKHIKETYANVIMQNITKECYSRQTQAVVEKDGVSYTTTSYRLDLNANIISNIILDILNTLKTDNITLNLVQAKAVQLGLNEEEISIDTINNTIDQIIEELDNENFMDMSFVVYAYKGSTIASEIIVKNTSKLTIYTDNSIKLKYENFEENAEFDVINIEISRKNTSTQSSTDISINVDDEKQYLLNIVNNGSATNGTLDTNITANITVEDITTEITYTGSTEFVNELENIENLNQTNSVILNDCSQQDLITILQAVQQRIVQVMNEKMQAITTYTIMNNSTNSFE